MSFLNQQQTEKLVGAQPGLNEQSKAEDLVWGQQVPIARQPEALGPLGKEGTAGVLGDGGDTLCQIGKIHFYYKSECF